MVRVVRIPAPAGWPLSWLSATHVEALIRLAFEPRLQPADLAPALRLKPHTCEQILAELESAGLLIRTGTDRGHRYQVATSLPLPSREELLALHRPDRVRNFERAYR